MPAASVPMRFPCTMLPSTSATRTPKSPLPEMTLPRRRAAPPIRLPGATIATPLLLPSGGAGDIGADVVPLNEVAAAPSDDDTVPAVAGNHVASPETVPPISPCRR